MWWYGRGNSCGSWLPEEEKANMWHRRGNSGGSWPPAFPHSLTWVICFFIAFDGPKVHGLFRVGTIVLIAPSLCITLTIVHPFLSNPLFCQHLKTLKIERFPDFRIHTRLVVGTGLRPFPPLPFPVYSCPPPSPPRFPSSRTVCSRPGQSFVWD